MAKAGDFVFKRGFKSKAEKLAVEYRTCLKIHPCAPLPSSKVAEFLNVPIFCVSDIVEDQTDLKRLWEMVSYLSNFSGVSFHKC